MKLDSEHLEILSVIVEKGGLTEGAELLGKRRHLGVRIVQALQCDSGGLLGITKARGGSRGGEPSSFAILTGCRTERLSLIDGGLNLDDGGLGTRSAGREPPRDHVALRGHRRHIGQRPDQ